MPIQKSQSSIETGKTGWISIRINDSQSPSGLPLGYGDNPQRDMSSRAPEVCHLFEQAQRTRASLPERFPRLTFAAIAVALLASALAAEFDYLHGAGYYWP
jgi:hypothetical protein